jgi:multiple antibiotic resistance protein
MFSDDVRHFLGALLLVVGGLLPIVNPIGSAPMFLAMTHGADAQTRRVLATKIAINSFALIMGSLIFGAYVLKVFGLSVPVVQVAGGAVLCALGWKPPQQRPAASRRRAAGEHRRRLHACVLPTHAAADRSIPARSRWRSRWAPITRTASSAC